MKTQYEALSSEFLKQRYSLMAFIRGMLRDDSVADDIFQEVWVQLYNAFEKGTEIHDLAKWTRGVARNLILKHWRKERNSKVVVNSEIMYEIACGGDKKIHPYIKVEEKLMNNTRKNMKRSFLLPFLKGFPVCVAIILCVCADLGGREARSQNESPDALPNSPNRQTKVEIAGEAFHLNGRPTYEGRTWQGHKIEGLLMNARLVQGIFDDLNPETVDMWDYPDGPWDPDRNTNEFVEAMPEWYAHGLRCAVVNLQGGSPEGYSREQPWHNSAIRHDGSLRPAYMDRLERIIDYADELGMVIMVSVFYFGQDQRLDNEEAVKQAVVNTVDWIADKGYTNVLIEIANEHDIHYSHDIIRNRPEELIALAQQRAAERSIQLPVSVSLAGGRIPSQAVVDVSDYILLHGNGVQNPKRMVEMVHTVREMAGDKPKPIVNNEDDRPWRGQGGHGANWGTEGTTNNFVACVRNYASWGYFDFRRDGESYDQGFQSVPANWQISSDRKRAFFNLLAEITGGEPTPIPDPDPETDLGMEDGTDTRPDSAGFVSAIRFTAQASFAADTLHARFAPDSGRGDMRMAIYADNNNSPGKLLGETEEFAFGPGLHSAALAQPVEIQEDAVYWLTGWHNSESGKVVAVNGIGSRFRVTREYSSTADFPEGLEFSHSADTTYVYFATGE